jgi:hypothetical protein
MSERGGCFSKHLLSGTNFLSPQTDSWETIKDESEEEQKRRGRRPFTPPPAQKLGKRMRSEMRQHQSNWLFRQRARDEDTMVRVGCLR